MCYLSSYCINKFISTYCQPEHIAEDFGNVKDRECSDNTSTEEPTGPTDPSADPTQSIDYITVNFLQNELEAASS